PTSSRPGRVMRLASPRSVRFAETRLPPKGIHIGYQGRGSSYHGTPRFSGRASIDQPWRELDASSVVLSASRPKCVQSNLFGSTKAHSIEVRFRGVYTSVFRMLMRSAAVM